MTPFIDFERMLAEPKHDEPQAESKHATEAKLGSHRPVSEDQASASAPLSLDELSLKLSEGLEPPTSEWIITESKCAYYASCFDDWGATDGLITVEEAIEKFQETDCSTNVLFSIWDLVDTHEDGLLNVHEFSMMMHIAERTGAGAPVPTSIPASFRPSAHRPDAVQIPNFATDADKDAWFIQAFNAVDTGTHSTQVRLNLEKPVLDSLPCYR
jgi:hypothetical protein